MRVFISYAHEDRTRAHQVADYLTTLEHEVFIDNRMTAGMDFRSHLKTRIEWAEAVVVLWTKSSIRSRWVQEEATLALETEKLRPVRFHVQPPFGFRGVHTPDLPLASTPAMVAEGAGLRGTNQTSLPPTGLEPRERPSIVDVMDRRGLGGRLSRWIEKCS